MIYLVRHAEPAAGWGHHQNPGLSELGRGQAEAAAHKLQEFGAAKAVTSPMARCIETAKPFEKLVETHARIEPRVGEIQTPSDIEDRVAWLRQSMSGEWSEMGSTYLDWQSTAYNAILTMDDETAVFTHYVAINAIVGQAEQDPRVHVFSPGHCSITMLVKNESELLVTKKGDETALPPL